MNFYISNGWLIILVTAVAWELAWKGIALWKAGRRNQMEWFIILLVINSVGILPIAYLLISKNKKLK